jgi:hypothetical protein
LNNNRGNNRRRGRGNNRQQGGGQQLNRIDSRARGNAPQLLEKYRKLAHDAHLNGDRVNEEYFLQFADHYFRVIADQRQRQEEQRQRRDDRWQEGGEADRDDSDYGADYSVESDYTAYDQPHRRESSYEQPNRRESSYDQSNRREREDRPPRRDREEREPEPRGEEAGDEQPTEQQGNERPVYEPAENPFVRENRSGRGLRPRRDDRRPRREPREDAGAETGDDAPASFDPTVLPPAISAGREETTDTTAPASAEEGEAKPRRRTRRPRPPADDAGETLEAVN